MEGLGCEILLREALPHTLTPCARPDRHRAADKQMMAHLWRLSSLHNAHADADAGARFDKR
jgi:hypothetical protein